MYAERGQIAFIRKQLLIKLNHLNYRCEESQLQRNEILEQTSKNDHKGQQPTNLPGFKSAACQTNKNYKSWLYPKQETGPSAVGGAVQGPVSYVTGLIHHTSTIFS